MATLNEVMAELEAGGSAQTRKTYSRHGITEPMFGVSYALLGKLQKKIKRDHALALQLWATGNHDARVLAIMIADPQAATSDQLDQWIADSNNYGLTDAIAGYAAQTPLALEKLKQWTQADGLRRTASGLKRRAGAFWAASPAAIPRCRMTSSSRTWTTSKPTFTRPRIASGTT